MTFIVTPPTAAAVPLLVSIPHAGTLLPPTQSARLASDAVRALPDTDWHLQDLYDFTPAMGATTLAARFSRYVVDLNRPTSGAALYPGRQETGLVPLITFAGEPIYAPGQEPCAQEVTARIEKFHAPYHAALRQQLDALRERFGYALLFEAHSIASWVPLFHPEPLPGLMLGDDHGKTAHAALSTAVAQVLAGSGMTFARNHPFKGGHITRAYGQPAHHVHALQLEMSQRLYMDEGPPFAYRRDLATVLQPVLRAALQAFVDAAAHAHA